jgi:hypothetical protein
MHPKNAKTELDAAIAAAGKQLLRLRPAEGIQLMLNFYRTVRAERCDMEQDGVTSNEPVAARWRQGIRRSG